jgi:hypothetical protein
MNQPSTLHTSQQTFKKVNNHSDYRSKFRDNTRKFDLPPSPASSHHSSIAIKINNNHRNETLTSSRSSSTDSITSEYIVNPSPIERKESLNPKHISTARLEIRPPTQSKPTVRHKRAVPPTPQSYSNKFLIFFF